MHVSQTAQTLLNWTERYVPTGYRANILLAVSGGSDSVGLLNAASEIGLTNGLNFRCATVDHGLRAESGKEANYVAQLCETFGIPHCVYRVEWGQGEVPSQARARAHRYNLLAGAANEVQASLVLTGHTLDDQLETVFMRERAGSSAWGLAGMAPLSMLPFWPEGDGIALGRPLLDMTRADIRSDLMESDIKWCDDPSNQSTSFERVRVRDQLRQDHQERIRLLNIAHQARLDRLRIISDLESTVDKHVQFLAGGGALVDSEFLKAADSQSVLRALQLLCICIAGHDQLPEVTRISVVLERLRNRQSETLGGCRFIPSDDGALILPEVVSKTAVPITANTMFWESRSRLSGLMDPTKNAVAIAPWSERAVPDHIDRSLLPGFAIRQALPVVLNGSNEIICVPHVEPNLGISAVDVTRSRFLRLLDAKRIFDVN